MLSRMILLSMILWSGRSAAQTTTFDRIQLGALPAGAAVIGDFNGDGKADVAVVQADKVLTFIGNGDGGFQEPLVTKISTGACGGRAGDFDGDGRTDLALSDKAYCIPIFNGEISILLSNGDGTFREFPDRIPDASADYVTDIDGDGLPDLVSAGESVPPGYTGPSASPAVLRSRGNGSFLRRDIPQFINLLTLVDLNGDGLADLIQSDAFSGPLRVGLGNGDGTFAYVSTILPDYNQMAGFTVGDFDGDGKPDLLARLRNGPTILYKGNGDGTFQPGNSVLNTTNDTTFGVLNAVDINGDGKLDVIVTGGNPPRLTIILGNGDGTFQSPVEIGSGSFRAVADFNGDGKPDLLILDQGSFYLLLNSTPAQLAEPPVVSATGFATAGFAPGMLVTVKGTFLADSTRTAKPPLPDDMAGTIVRVNGIRALLTYVSPSQVNLQIPFGLSAGHGTLEVDRGSGRLFSLAIELTEFAPAIFTTNQAGTGAAVALHRDGTLVGDQSPANAGQTISILCTGLGRLSQPVPSGVAPPDPAPSTLATPQVTIGGVPAAVTFSGLAAGYVGVYRVDIVIPDAPPRGNASPLVLSIGASAASPVTIPVN